jgi:FkbM family methyltransferase
MAAHLELLPRYLKSLGLYQGLRTFVQLEFLKRKKFKPSGYSHPIYVRPSTTDINVFREVFLFHAYGFKTEVTPEVVIDAGANIGLSSIFFANRFPKATIYAIEPERSNFEYLLKNTAHYPAITAVNTALWHRDTMLKIHDQNENHWAFTVEECEQKDPDCFPAISLRSFMEQNKIEWIDVLKMDIEGSEREIFSEDCDYWLSRTKVIIIELHDWLKAGSSSVFFKTISDYKIRTLVHEGMLLIEILR